MSVSLQLVLSKKLYIRDPEQTDLGRKIVDYGIKLIHELGFEKFTFKKLANAIGSTEASIYRYFENKHKLLLYLVSWYWSWLEYLIDYQTNNIEDPKQQLRIAVEVLANCSQYDPNFSHIDEVALHRIVVAEGSKAFLTKNIDGENAEGLFRAYKNLAARLSKIVSRLNPDFPHPNALTVTLIETSHKQIFFAQHMPGVTELRVQKDDTTEVASYLEDLVLRALSRGPEKS